MQKIKQKLVTVIRHKLALSCLVLSSIAITIAVAWTLHSQPVATYTAPKDRIVTQSTDAPSEVRPATNYQWQGNPNDPKKIKIDSVGVDAYLQKVGVDQHQSVAVPNNVHMGGWFVDSVRPGDKGLSIIDGHYDGRTQSEAIFKELAKAVTGDQIVVEFGDGTNKAFKISGVTTTTIADAPSVLFSQDPKATNQLNLITCTGVYDRANKTYDKRVIVTAQLVL